MPNSQQKSNKKGNQRGSDSDGDKTPQKTRLTGEKRKNIKFDEMDDLQNSQSPLKSPNRKSQRLEYQRKGIKLSNLISQNNNAIPGVSKTSKKPDTVSDLDKSIGREFKSPEKTVSPEKTLNPQSKIYAKSSSQIITEADESKEDQTTHPIEGEILTDVELGVQEDDDFPREESSDEETDHRFRKDGRRVIERQFPPREDNTAGSQLSDEDLIKQIEQNPRIWNMINGMVNKAQSNQSNVDQQDFPEAVATVTEATNESTPLNTKQKRMGNKVTDRGMNESNLVKTKSHSDTTVYVPALNKVAVENMVKSPEIIKPTTPVRSQTNTDEVFDKISNYLDRIRIEVSEKGSA